MAASLNASAERRILELTKELSQARGALAEALEQQTATGGILRAISNSPTDLQGIFQEIATTAARLCEAYDAGVVQCASDHLRLVAHRGHIPSTGQGTLPLSRGVVVGRAVLDRTILQVPDLQAETEEYPEGSEFARRVGHRTILAVPLIRGREAIGAIFVRRTEVRPFTDRQIELLKTFADQAVIAIENTRLFEAEQASKRELQESLDYQIATSEVLGVISRSKFNLQPVMDTILATASRLIGADRAGMRRRVGVEYKSVALYGYSDEEKRYLTEQLNTRVPQTIRQAVETKQTIQLEDLGNNPSNMSDVAKRLGVQTALGVPLLREGELIGAMGFYRTEKRPFTPQQIELVNTFADQAVIAIENTRLFEEVQARTRELAKTVQDLEIASQHKNQFVANMSHELRTPLAAILGYAELIQEGFYGALPEKSLNALTRIRSNGKHLLGLINTVLDIAKIESGQFTLNMTEYAIESVVETVRAATESLAQNKKLTLTTSVDKSLPVGLGDEQRLTQVLLNLVGNAIKFTDTGEVRVTAKASNGHFNISVTDTGPGIPSEHQARIFEQFHQVDSSNTKAKGGTGLGLAIAKQIVEMHGGRIWVVSMAGKGSTFQMELPTRAEFRKPAA
jgi:signal transduction histidine kinase